jgi:ABC-2 type transport system permease protein
MRNIWTIARREYNLYFNSTVAYAIFFTIMVVLGLIFAINILQANQYAYYGGYAPDITLVTGPLVFMLVLASPAITMRLLADEQRMGTMEILLTAPIRDWELVVGKWLGAFLFMLTLIAATLIFPLILNQFVMPSLDLGSVIAGYLGVILVSASFLGIGVGISALFSNQIAAFFTTLVTLVLLWWIIGAPANVLQGNASELFQYLDLQHHFYDTMFKGVIALSDLVYFISLTILGNFIGTVAVDIRRWR